MGFLPVKFTNGEKLFIVLALFFGLHLIWLKYFVPVGEIEWHFLVPPFLISMAIGAVILKYG